MSYYVHTNWPNGSVWYHADKIRCALKGLLLLNTTDLPMADFWTNKNLQEPVVLLF